METASLKRRFGALVVDVGFYWFFGYWLCSLVVLMFFLIVDLAAHGHAGGAIQVGLITALDWLIMHLYECRVIIPIFVLIIYLWCGSTSPGKYIFGLRVVSVDTGGVVSFGRSCLYAVTWCMSACFAGVGFLPALIRKDRKSVPDLLSGVTTICVRKR